MQQHRIFIKKSKYLTDINVFRIKKKYIPYLVFLLDKLPSMP